MISQQKPFCSLLFKSDKIISRFNLLKISLLTIIHFHHTVAKNNAFTGKPFTVIIFFSALKNMIYCGVIRSVLLIILIKLWAFHFHSKNHTRAFNTILFSKCVCCACHRPAKRIFFLSVCVRNSNNADGLTRKSIPVQCTVLCY